MKAHCPKCGAALTQGTERAPCPSCGFHSAKGSSDLLPELESFPVEPSTPTTSSRVDAEPYVPRMSLARFNPGPRRSPLGIGLTVAGIVLLASVTVVVIRRATLRSVAPEVPVAANLEPTLARWRLSFPEMEGTSATQLAAAETALVRDTQDSGREAEQLFQQAVLLDPLSDDAIAGYGRAVALLRGAEVDNATLEEALALIEVAEQRSKRSVPTLLAHAMLLACRPEESAWAQKAQLLAEEAVARATPEWKARAQAALGHAVLARSAELAVRAFDAALALDPKLPRVYRDRAQAKVAMGELDEAMNDLRARLAVDPGHWETLRQLGQLLADVGEVRAARALYENATDAESKGFKPRLALAVLAYQHDDAKDGVAKLRQLAKGVDSLEDDDAVELLTHLAAACRAAGDPGAEEAARLALTRGANDAGAHLQLLLVQLSSGGSKEAPQHAAVTLGRLADRGLEHLLEGLALWSAGDVAGASAAFNKARYLDDRRTDATLWSAIAAAKLGQRDEALKMIRRFMDADPDGLGPRLRGERFFMLPNDTVRGAAGVLPAIQQGPEDLYPQLGEVWLAYHSRELEAANRRVDQVLEMSSQQPAGLALKALIEMRGPNPSACTEWAQAAVRADRSLPLARYALGLCLKSNGDTAEARKVLREAMAVGPGLVSAELALASLESPADARTRLLHTLHRDATCAPAKRALYGLQHRGSKR